MIDKIEKEWITKYDHNAYIKSVGLGTEYSFFCGYVEILIGHRFYPNDKNYNDYEELSSFIDVHYGLTYSVIKNGIRTLGFDTGHGTNFTLLETINETNYLSEQLKLFDIRTKNEALLNHKHKNKHIRDLCSKIIKEESIWY